MAPAKGLAMDNAAAKTEAVKSALNNAKRPGLPPVIQDALKMLPKDAGAMFEPQVADALKALRKTSLAELARVRSLVKQAGNVKMADFDQATLIPGQKDD